MQFSEGMPIYIQIAGFIKEKIALGQLTNGDKFPSIRDIANEYKVNPNTVQRSTQLLEQEGIIYSKRGIGSFIVDDPKIVENTRVELAREYSDLYLERMKKIGFDLNQVSRFLLEEYDG